MGHTTMNSWNGSHLEFPKLLNDASWASFRFFNNNIFTYRIK